MLWFIITVFISQIMFDRSRDFFVTSRELPLDNNFLICNNEKHVLKQTMPCLCPGRGRVFTEQSLIQQHSTTGFNPLPFYTPFLTEMVPLVYTFYWQMWPLSHTYSLEHFNCYKCTILLICINNKTRKLSYLFTAIKYICWPFLSFHRAKWQIFLHQLMKSLTSRISEAWKRYTFGQSSGIHHYREYPLERLMSTLVPFSGRQWWLCVFFKTYKQNNHTH